MYAWGYNTPLCGGPSSHAKPMATLPNSSQAYPRPLQAWGMVGSVPPTPMGACSPWGPHIPVIYGSQWLSHLGNPWREGLHLHGHSSHVPPTPLGASHDLGAAAAGWGPPCQCGTSQVFPQHVHSLGTFCAHQGKMEPSQPQNRQDELYKTRHHSTQLLSRLLIVASPFVGGGTSGGMLLHPCGQGRPMRPAWPCLPCLGTSFHAKKAPSQWQPTCRVLGYGLAPPHMPAHTPKVGALGAPPPHMTCHPMACQVLLAMVQGSRKASYAMPSLCPRAWRGGMTPCQRGMVHKCGHILLPTQFRC